MTTASSLADSVWFRDAGVATVFALLDGQNGTTRIVGGAIRNALLGHQVHDIDFATALLPDAVMARAKAAGLKVVPTGLAHGTVTLVIDGTGFEITTLRHDVETDGRRARVAFTDDWVMDAARRDFTMNALYLSAGGMLFDPNGGLADINKRTVCFIGDPTARIREDYLRILRFFRMQAWYGGARLDPAALAATEAEKAGLAKLSAERVGHELLRLLDAPNPMTALRAMAGAGVLDRALGVDADLAAMEKLVAIESTQTLKPDPVLRLGVLAAGAPVRERLRLSNADAARIAALGDAAMPAGSKALQIMILDHGGRTARDLVLAAWARSNRAPDDLDCAGYLAATAEWSPPDFPVSGRDAMALGIADGPMTGTALAHARQTWLDSDFKAGRQELIAAMAARYGDKAK